MYVLCVCAHICWYMHVCGCLGLNVCVQCKIDKCSVRTDTINVPSLYVASSDSSSVHDDDDDNGDILHYYETESRQEGIVYTYNA